ncbi:unnamed protein product [Lactuca saligna]|uniref:OTU domain-containing protein n=1 Tax=Lactuca saligna TaxID=75948 RepID=A0AA35ZVA0_LACSI|nr:unnamed protein product [Lactuca saligna]
MRNTTGISRERPPSEFTSCCRKSHLEAVGIQIFSPEIASCGEYKATNTIKASGSRKTNCKFELQGKYSKVLDRWTLRVKCDEHNHAPAQHMEGHPFARRLSVDENRLVANLTRKHVARCHILSTLKEQNENNVSVIKTIYNAQQKIRMHEKAGKTPMQVLMSILHNNNYIYELTTEGDGNCGFRAVAVCLGYNEDQWLYIRKQLLEELESQYYAYHRVFTDGFNELRCLPPSTLIDSLFYNHRHLLTVAFKKNRMWFHRLGSPGSGDRCSTFTPQTTCEFAGISKHYDVVDLLLCPWLQQLNEGKTVKTLGRSQLHYQSKKVKVVVPFLHLKKDSNRTRKRYVNNGVH